jgi:hypothetical protein
VTPAVKKAVLSILELQPLVGPPSFALGSPRFRETSGYEPAGPISRFLNHDDSTALLCRADNVPPAMYPRQDSNLRPLDPQSDTGRISLSYNDSQWATTSANRLLLSPVDSPDSHLVVTTSRQRRAPQLRALGPSPWFAGFTPHSLGRRRGCNDNSLRTTADCAR